MGGFYTGLPGQVPVDPRRERELEEAEAERDRIANELYLEEVRRRLPVGSPGRAAIGGPKPAPAAEPAGGGGGGGSFDPNWQLSQLIPTGAAPAETTPTLPTTPSPLGVKLPPGFDPQGEGRRFVESRRGKPVSPDYLGIPDYEIAQRGEAGYDPAAAGERAQFLDRFVKQKLADDLAYAQYGQEMERAQIDPREAMAAEVGLTQARAQLAGAEAGARGAEEQNIRARTALLNDPVAMAAKQGRASADELLAYRERVLTQAATEVDSFLMEKLAVDMLKAKAAPTIEAARQVVRAQMARRKYDEILAQDPQLRQAMIRAGMMFGAAQ